MIIKTKKYKLPKSIYIKNSLSILLLQQWWILLLILSSSLSFFYFKSVWCIVLPIVGALLFLGFWALQFYGVTIMEQSKTMFEKVSYEITSRQILMQLTTKQGIPIQWKHIKKAYIRKKYFLLVISKGHIIFLPHKIFTSKSAINLLSTIIKRKKI